jgi:3-methyladenine DNA glycosylase AlkC
MRKHKTLITVVVLITAALAVCLVVAAVFSSLARRPKPGAFDDSDLIPTRIEVPVESNAFWTLLQATNELYWPKSLDHKLSDLSNNTNWDDSLAAEVLEKNHACLDWFNNLSCWSPKQKLLMRNILI